MSVKIQIFSNPEFGQVRTVMMDNEPWFIGKDVATALGYAKPRNAIATHVDGSDKGALKQGTLGGEQEMIIINESGMYSLIFASKLPTAKKFKHWVTSEVLPSIRKHGAYMTPEKIEEALYNPDTIIKLATSLKEEQQKRQEAERKVEAQKGKVAYAEAMLGCKSSCLIGELAKILTLNGITIGQNRLFKWLRESSYLGKGGANYNMPAQRYVEQGLFDIKPTMHSENENLVMGFTTKVTPKGQMYFINGFKSGRFNA